ncbi:sensor histidine kinase [Comamonas testosteroni]|uniref:sensor histidine kinase n=1 Tax=Comamonas testosteroni TaxID=285 RepID=UPI00265F2FD0|nr:ATP-binding protein [Comamonas testosteroni]WKL15513.1 ATP-binding protein [Comamonas testosteroni]
MESLRNPGWRATTSFLQAVTLISWSFLTPLRDQNWFFVFSILVAFGGLLISLHYILGIYRVIKARLRSSAQPSKEIQEERKRIASDLHDTLGSQLIEALSLMNLQSSSEDDPARKVLEQSLLDLRLIVDSMDAQSDNLAMRLARLRYRLEPALQRKGLVLHWQLTDPELGVGQQTTLPLPRDRVAHEILAVVQASVSNAIEHADATEIWLTLEPYQKGDLQSFGWDWYLSIEDNGKGYDLRAVLNDPSKSGHGVINMFHRMRNIGGDLHIHPRHGGGTQVLMRWRCESTSLS